TDTTDFRLALGGMIKGYFRTASNTAIPGRTAVARQGGNVAAQAVSDNTGYFYLLNLATGSYVLQPSLDPAEVSSPSSSTVVLLSTGVANSVSTFTITNGLSEITGQALTASTQPITTGVLVLASTTSLGGTSASLPPLVDGATGPLCSPSCYYAGSTDAVGSYSIYVRSNAAPYFLYGWYTKFTGTTPSTT